MSIFDWNTTQIIMLLMGTAKSMDIFANPSLYAPWIAALSLLVVTIVTQWFQYRMFKKSYEHNTNILLEKKNEERRKEIYKKLNEFYGPFQQHLTKSAQVYDVFAQDKPAGFRTLTYLLDKNQEYGEAGKLILTENDEAILKEIIEIGKSLEELILTKSGLVDDSDLRAKHLPRIGTHLLMIRLAHQGKLNGNTDKYSQYVFPRDIPAIIERHISRLNNELLSLNTL